ncbi:MAG: mandelate racemase/muconate lactonizing enzyme family protein [Pseudomonadota bacterium]
MRITDIRELSVQLQGNVANALVNFSEHTISLVAVFTDAVRNGKPVVGLAFDSIGRYAQGGILRERIIPRVMAAARSAPDSLIDSSGSALDVGKLLQVMLKNEKPGGHGDRAAAVGALELAFWDVNAKLADEPAWRTIARHFGTDAKTAGVHVYAAGGYYYPDDSTQRLRDEFRAYQDMGFDAFKMKIGGASLAEDMARIEAALDVAGSGQRLAVDANGRFDLATALAYAKAMAPLDLRWYEEIGDPLDYDLNRRVVEAYSGTVATGENLFSLPDVNNLLLFGGMRPGRDVFQMDPGLSYGLLEYGRMLSRMETGGFSRDQAHPHGGHLINLHIAVGLGLGGCEAYPGVFQPFGGYPTGCAVGGGLVRPTDAPGFGLEEKTELPPFISQLTA